MKTTGEEAKQYEPSPEDDYTPDLRTVIGYLNQTEWIQNINIGNIMSINPYPITDILFDLKNESSLYWESLLTKLSLIVVAYFCVSTELRFKATWSEDKQMPEDQKQILLEEAEFWHTKSL